MSRRTMRVVLDVVVEDLSPEEREACAEGLAFSEDDDPEDSEDEGEQLGCIADNEYTADDFASLIADGLHPDDTEMFAGTGIYAKFGSATLVSAEWTTAFEGERP